MRKAERDGITEPNYELVVSHACCQTEYALNICNLVFVFPSLSVVISLFCLCFIEKKIKISDKLNVTKDSLHCDKMFHQIWLYKGLRGFMLPVK